MIALLNKQFLRQLDQYRHKTIYAKVISLNNKEEPIEKIEGVVTGGSISVDGTSAIRRSCNLTMTSQNVNINNVYWGITNKVSIEIGLQNDIDNRYDKIIWFPQGIYILTDFKTSHQVNNYTITLNAKDKMCLLNGDISGTFNAETDLGIEYLVDENKEITERKIPISEIIIEMIRHYAKEPFANIIINDLDSFGLQLLENKNADKVYFLLYSTEENNDNGRKTLKYLLEKDTVDSISCLTNSKIKKISDLEKYKDELSFYQTIEEDDINLINAQTNFSIFMYKGKKVYVQRIGTGDTIGYTPIDLVYPDELVASVGESVTSILDKIIQVLGDFEYFYNLKGQFVFQKKKTYISSSWSNILNANGENYISPAKLSEKISYSFDNSVLITSFQNDPKLSNIKNDYTVWGSKRTSEGAEIPIHARYAIDKKPEFYYSFELQNNHGDIIRSPTFYTIYKKNKLPANISLPENTIIRTVDWREIIYQMALDYYKYYHTDMYEYYLRQNNQFFIDNKSAYPRGETGYEQYYHDIQGFWRLLYLGYDNIPEDTDLTNYFDANDKYYPLWNKDVINNPTGLIFWFDFFDSFNSEIEKFSIPAIGDRTKNINDDKIRAIIYPDTPDIVFIEPGRNDQIEIYNNGYQVFTDIDANSGIISSMSVSTRRKTIHDQIDTMLYDYSYFNNSITMSSVPIYYLEPNSIISVDDNLSNIHGYFTLSKFTIPLTYNGTMSITAVKIPQKIY